MKSSKCLPPSLAVLYIPRTFQLQEPISQAYTHSKKDFPQLQTAQLTLKSEHESALSQKIGKFDRNNLNRHGHKQTQMENVVLFCSELNTFTLFSDVSSIHFTWSAWVTRFLEMMEPAPIKQLALFREFNFCHPNFVFMFIQWVCHVRHLSLSLFLVTIFLQHNLSPALAVLPALQGATLHGHSHPPILWHNTSLSCNFYFKQTVPLCSQRFCSSDACLLQPWASR